MFGITIKKTADLEAMSTKLANAQAQVRSQEKKTRTAAIIGGSTTAATAAAAIVAHKLFGTGKKINKEKLNNYDQVVEERDRVIGEKATLAKDLDSRTLERDAAMASGHKLVIAAETRDGKALNAAIAEHKYFSDMLYGKEGCTAEKVKERIDMFDAFLEELHKADKTPATPAAPATPATPATATEADLKAAQDAFNAACKKAGDAKNALEAAKAAEPNGDHSDLEAAFEAANKELEDADKALKALQAK